MAGPFEQERREGRVTEVLRLPCPDPLSVNIFKALNGFPAGMLEAEVTLPGDSLFPPSQLASSAHWQPYSVFSFQSFAISEMLARCGRTECGLFSLLFSPSVILHGVIWWLLM